MMMILKIVRVSEVLVLYIYIYIDSNNNKHLLSLLGNMLSIILYHLGITIQYVDRDNISKKEM